MSAVQYHVEEQVAVVTVTYNSAHLLPEFLSSLTDGLGGTPWHLVVADNASQDDSVDVLRSLAPDATLVQTGSNAGYAAGINAAVAAAPPHTAVLVLNPDVRLSPGCVGPLLRAVREPGVGVAVPRLVDGESRLISSMRREPTLARAFADALVGATRAGRLGRLGEVVTDPRHYEHETLTDWAEGSTQLISAECWQVCGGWDESFFLYSEETDFDLRARDAGFSTKYVPAAGAVHLKGDSATSPALWSLLTVNRLRLFRRRHGVVATAAFWLAMLIREGSRSALGKETSRAAFRALVDPRRVWLAPAPTFVG